MFGLICGPANFVVVNSWWTLTWTTNLNQICTLAILQHTTVSLHELIVLLLNFLALLKVVLGRNCQIHMLGLR